MDYTDLQSRLADLLDRTDLTDQIPGFIELAEAGFSGSPQLGGLRHWRMEQRARVDVDEQYLTFPPGWIETIRLFNNTNGNTMDLLSREAMQAYRANTQDTAGIPHFYRHSQGNYEIYPTPASLTSLELEYYARVQRLGKDDYGTGENATTNWVVDLYPDVYLYGSALHSAPYLQDDARIQTWGGLYSAAVARLNEESNRAEYSTSSPRLRNKGMPGSRTQRNRNSYRA